ncbi:putative ribonuclease H-like domain-containing protein [Tanacetum coccineum]
MCIQVDPRVKIEALKNREKDQLPQESRLRVSKIHHFLGLADNATSSDKCSRRFFTILSDIDLFRYLSSRDGFVNHPRKVNLVAVMAISMEVFSDEYAESPRLVSKAVRIVVRNKARLVAQGYTQEEGIDYDEVFALVARIEAIRLFLAYASFMGFIVYQMDVKCAFLYGTIEEEVYVCQPPGFEDPQFPDKVYKVEKVLYGLHQAPKAWYETLSTYLLKNGFRRGTIDKTMFIKKDRGDILLVQVYVDDIIFGYTKKSLCDEFEQMIHKKFQTSSMGELTFFLGLQVQQKNDGIFISQDKYVVDILKKFDFITVKTTSTPTETNKALIKDEEAENVDVPSYTKDFTSSCCEEDL